MDRKRETEIIKLQLFAGVHAQARALAAGVWLLAAFLFFFSALPAHSQQPPQLPSFNSSAIVSAVSDSIGLQAALDSLQKQKLSPAALAHKVDSIKQAFATKQAAALQKLKQTPLAKGAEQLQKATEQVLPPSATEALQQLKPEAITGKVPTVNLPATPNLPTTGASLPTIPDLPAITNPAAALADKVPAIPQFSPEELEGFKRAKEFFSSHKKELAEAQPLQWPLR